MVCNVTSQILGARLSILSSNTIFRFSLRTAPQDHSCCEACTSPIPNSRRISTPSRFLRASHRPATPPVPHPTLTRHPIAAKCVRELQRCERRFYRTHAGCDEPAVRYGTLQLQLGKIYTNSVLCSIEAESERGLGKGGKG